MAHAQSKEPRGVFGTLAKLTMFAIDYWVGYWLCIRPKLSGSMLVVSDRYYDDVLVDPLRYRILGARLFARVLLPWIPRPHLWLVFDAPADVLASRQSDVSAAESSRLRGEYRRVLRAHESVVVLDARQPVDEVVAQAERAIVSHIARRTARRHGLPVPTTRNPRTSELLLFFCRRQVPLLSRLIRVAFNSDIYCRLPDDIHLPHPYGIVMHPQAAIGNRVTVMQQVTIGSKDPSDNVAPVIGDDVYIGAGARVLGDVRIGNGAVIGANAVVTRDIPPGVTVVGANRILSAQIQRTPGASGASVAQFPSHVHRG
jgi:serine O-acetyltransferase